MINNELLPIGCSHEEYTFGDVPIGGQTRKAVMVANRNGFFYALDRATGKLLVAKPFTSTKWAREIGADGRPMVLDNDGTSFI